MLRINDVLISPSQVGRYLREAALQPHKSRYWLNTTETDPVRFEEQVKAVCDTYLTAPQRKKVEGTHLPSAVDEMTGLGGAGADRLPARR